MKIALSELDDFLSDPEQWAERKSSATGFGRVGYAHVTRMGIYRYHQSGSLASAQSALIGYLDSYKLSNSERRELAEETLRRYVSWSEHCSDFVIAHSLRMRLDLSSGIYVSGQIHRVDLLTSSAVHQPVMLEAGANSQSRVLAAVVRAGYSKAAARQSGLVVPAHQNLDGSGLTPVAVSDRQASAILSRLNSASREAARVLSR